eukprot:13488154-Heterocapsa_arctica.AAC.1
MASGARVMLEAYLGAPFEVRFQWRGEQWSQVSTHAAGGTWQVWCQAGGRVRVREQPVGSPFGVGVASWR